MGRSTCGMANGIGNIRICLSGMIKKSFAIINIRFRALCNAYHCLQSFHGIFPGCRLSGKHDSTGSIVNGIGHICRLCTGGSWIFHHGIQHLCGSNYLFSCLIDFANNHFLYHRYFLIRHLHSHISPGNHDSI